MRIINYIQESFKELVQKVTWPSWAELQSSAIVVMIASFMIAMVIFFMDYGFSELLKLVYKII